VSSILVPSSLSVSPGTFVVASLATFWDLATLWIVCELLWKRIEWARPGRIRIEAGGCLPRPVRTTKFNPALAVRPLVAGGGAQPFLLALCWATLYRTTCWGWRRRRGACWSWLVRRDAEDDGAKVAKDPGYSVDQLDPGAHRSAWTAVTVLNATGLAVALLAYNVSKQGL